MRRGKSFVASILLLISIIAIMTVVILLTESIWLMIGGIFLCGVVWLFFDTLESKGTFVKIDDKIYATAIFQFLHRRRGIVFFVLISLGLLVTLLVI